MKSDVSEEKKVVIRAQYELFIAGLLTIQLFNSLLVVVLGDSQVEQIPKTVGLGISIYLIADVIFRLVRVPNRRRFLFTYQGYLTVLGCLPIPFFSIFWLAWYRNTIVKLRRADFHDMEQVVIHKRAQSALLAVVLAAIVVLEVSSIFIVKFEEYAPGSLIVTSNDAMWWSLVTMATVGYGDMYPVTAEGRVVAVFVMIVGVSIFTVLTSFLAQSFVRPRSTRPGLFPEDAEGPSHPSESLGLIKLHLDQHEVSQRESIDALRAKVDELEKLIVENSGASAGASRKPPTETER